MRTFAVTTEEGPVGEVAEFSDGQVVVSWMGGDTVSRFQDLSTLRTALSTFGIDPLPVEPLALRLQRAREAAGLTQRGLSREIGVSFSTISRIEAGKSYVFNQTIEDWVRSQ